MNLKKPICKKQTTKSMAAKGKSKKKTTSKATKRTKK